ncbi:transcriptional regulator [Frankia sp. CNm7]|uniref:Transcriptional regulator n=1 Tax=Frankia nepalensis TaxID=1836974 RepID=A0A937REJ3_9ACTN|nr:transcriptional regulator [Frankia nepalensis]MBL7499853.1 transcriptional regulator [Frankia nepalensis]MBL7513976.1 transcriptional regulator [Frankia nepalensis]MBL7517700.1 transcriptional regulator [Frankia nepalensis]MBL7628557.1 transcriptional regulator [Frankia nepalensis]
MSSSTSAGDPASPNVFARLLGETGVSDTRFAKQVNSRARYHRRIELGLARTTVGHWRRGMKPRDPMVAELAAAEVSALVGYPVLPADLGWRGEHYGREDLGLHVADTPVQTVRTLAGLTGRDMRRRDVIQEGTAFVASAFAEPVLSSITGVIRRALHASTETSTSGAAVIRDMTETFRRLDARFGGGEIRSQVVTFLHDRVRVTMSDDPDADLCSALAELTQFGGWLAQDGDRQALAQRYYIQALSLAEHADDAQLAGRVLAAMSDQAARLGFHRQSLSMACAAVDRAARKAAPPVEAMLHDKRAWAHAYARDEPGCVTALTAMERAIERGAAGDEPAWAAHYNAGDVAECVGHCYLLLGRPEVATEHLIEARSLQDPTRARTRGFAEADLAISYLRRRSPDVDAALEASQRAVDHARPVNSARVTDKMRELDTAFAPYHESADIQEWRASASEILSRFPGPTRASGTT